MGGGSAGCVLANRLSSSLTNRVLLIEAGGWDINPWIHVPVGYFKTMHNPSVDWCFTTTPQEHLNGRVINYPRGKVMGGSSSLNGLLYVRGQVEDYRHWRQLGNRGWDWEDVLPFFIKSEKFEGGEDDYHGREGSLSVSKPSLKRDICDLWIESSQNCGYRLADDYNSDDQEGVSYFYLTVGNGLRCSASRAFIRGIRGRENLEIMTRTSVKRVLFEGNKAVGVEIVRSGWKDGESEKIYTSGEVILSSGAIGSPQILMLSGVGSGEHLKKHGIECLKNLRGVGENLQDHLQARLVHKTKSPTLNDEVGSIFNKMKIGLEYIFFRTGPMTMAASLVTGFLRTREEIASPDIQFHIQPWSADSPGEGLHEFSAFTSSVCQLRPHSRGRVSLLSGDFRDAPIIDPNYLSDEYDREVMLEGVKIARRICETSPLSEEILESFRPLASVQGDDELLSWLRDNTTTIYHPTSTCKMGLESDSLSVVDDRLKVHGMEGLRVVDCSIMPTITSGNTNAPAIMIGERASDFILKGE